jgi:hypothetical protein
MLGGLDPVIIFQFRKKFEFDTLTNEQFMALSTDELESQYISLPPIPVYLSEKLFNIAIHGTSKSIDIETDTETQTDGKSPEVNQKGIQSSVEINIEGKQSSVALTLISALVDQVFERVTSKEYTISFIYGATTVFGGLLHTYAVETVEGTDKLAVKISLSKGSKNPTKPNTVAVVPGFTGTLPGG